MAKALRAARSEISFVTLTTHGRNPVFDISRVAEQFIDLLLHYRMLGYYKLHAFVVMPDHAHLLLTPQSITLQQTVRLIKGGLEQHIQTAPPIWEENFIGYSVAGMHDLEIVRAYLHQVPVRAGLVTKAGLYPYSSAFRDSIRDISTAQEPSAVPAVANFPRKSPRTPATSHHKIAS
ncbi:MAG TPA: transposase [Acidobacteriaceae bacterium]|nr:transposase [Acidobacteriaceae bacterium]